MARKFNAGSGNILASVLILPLPIALINQVEQWFSILLFADFDSKRISSTKLSSSSPSGTASPSLQLVVQMVAKDGQAA